MFDHSFVLLQVNHIKHLLKYISNLSFFTDLIWTKTAKILLQAMNNGPHLSMFLVKLCIKKHVFIIVYFGNMGFWMGAAMA